MTAMANVTGDRMDPVLKLLNQRPREGWSWKFEPDATAHNAVNAVALCNAALLTYSDSATVSRFLTTNWQFDDPQILRGFHTQGFVAPKDNIVIVAFRGTEPTNAGDWLSDVNYQQRKLHSNVPGLVHDGFARALEEVQDPMIGAVKKLSEGGGRRVFVTGHSLGGALAVLAASVLQFSEAEPIAAVYTYGQPRVGDPKFSAAFDAELRDLTFRYVNDQDIVPHLPLTQMPGHPDVRAPSSFIDGLPSFPLLPAQLKSALDTIKDGERFDHVGRLKLFLEDGTLTNDEQLWVKREVGFGPEIMNVIGRSPNELRIKLHEVLRPGRRILDHDPLNGYLPKLEKQLR